MFCEVALPYSHLLQCRWYICGETLGGSPWRNKAVQLTCAVTETSVSVAWDICRSSVELFQDKRREVQCQTDAPIDSRRCYCKFLLFSFWWGGGGVFTRLGTSSEHIHSCICRSARETFSNSVTQILVSSSCTLPRMQKLTSFHPPWSCRENPSLGLPPSDTKLNVMSVVAPEG